MDKVFLMTQVFNKILFLIVEASIVLVFVIHSFGWVIGTWKRYFDDNGFRKDRISK